MSKLSLPSIPRQPALLVAATALLFSATASAAPKIPPVAFGVEKCVPTVLAKQPGKVLQALLKLEKGDPVWEIEVEGNDGRLWDIECSGKTGAITETEERFRSSSHPSYASKVKVSEADATKTVLAKHPSRIKRVEYELESDGTPVYEFDIELVDGTDLRVEVDAVTGALRETKPELVEIGRIPR